MYHAYIGRYYVMYMYIYVLASRQKSKVSIRVSRQHFLSSESADLAGVYYMTKEVLTRILKCMYCPMRVNHANCDRSKYHELNVKFVRLLTVRRI